MKWKFSQFKFCVHVSVVHVCQIYVKMTNIFPSKSGLFSLWKTSLIFWWHILNLGAFLNFCTMKTHSCFFWEWYRHKHTIHVYQLHPTDKTCVCPSSAVLSVLVLTNKHEFKQTNMSSNKQTNKQTLVHTQLWLDSKNISPLSDSSVKSLGVCEGGGAKSSTTEMKVSLWALVGRA